MACWRSGLIASSCAISSLPVAQDPARKDDRNKPASCPVMTRLCASPCMGQVLQNHASAIRSLTRMAVGKGCLRRWEMEEVDVRELHENLQNDADKYAVMDSMSEDGDNDE
jgi:hypothetical protein